jgi:hypothetical protein
MSNEDVLFTQLVLLIVWLAAGAQALLIVAIIVAILVLLVWR